MRITEYRQIKRIIFDEIRINNAVKKDSYGNTIIISQCKAMNEQLLTILKRINSIWKFEEE